MNNVKIISDHKDYKTDSLTWKQVDALSLTIAEIKGEMQSVEWQEETIRDQAICSEDIPF